MTPVSPVMQGSADIETIIGRDQPPYTALPTVVMDMRCCPMVSRWRLDDDERAAIAAGADIVLQQLTFRNPFQPINMQVVMPDANPVLVEDVA